MHRCSANADALSILRAAAARLSDFCAVRAASDEGELLDIAVLPEHKARRHRHGAAWCGTCIPAGCGHRAHFSRGQSVKFGGTVDVRKLQLCRLRCEEEVLFCTDRGCGGHGARSFGRAGPCIGLSFYCLLLVTHRSMRHKLGANALFVRLYVSCGFNARREHISDIRRIEE